MAGAFDTASPALSIRGYAKRIGVDESTVRDAIANGRLTESVAKSADGKTRIDPERADAEWAARTSPAASRRRPRPAAPESAPASAPSGEDHSTEYRRSLVLEKTVKTRLAMLRLEVEEGRFIPAEDVRREHFEIARQLRARLNELPDRLADELAAEKDAHRVREILARELRDFLSDEAMRLGNRS